MRRAMVGCEPTGEPLHVVPRHLDDGFGARLGRPNNMAAVGFGATGGMGEQLDPEGHQPGAVAGCRGPINGRGAPVWPTPAPEGSDGSPLLVEDDEDERSRVKGPTANGSTHRARGRGVDGPVAICGRPSH